MPSPVRSIHIAKKEGIGILTRTYMERTRHEWALGLIVCRDHAHGQYVRKGYDDALVGFVDIHDSAKQRVNVGGKLGGMDLDYGIDQIHTAFRTTQGLYYNKVMSFGLKNSGATFIRLMGKMFYELQRKVLEVYVDDIIIKSKKAADHAHNINTVLKVINRFKIKLNPEKRSFNVRSGQFLGCIIDQKGIQASSLKVE